MNMNTTITNEIYDASIDFLEASPPSPPTLAAMRVLGQSDFGKELIWQRTSDCTADVAALLDATTLIERCVVTQDQAVQFARVVTTIGHPWRMIWPSLLAKMVSHLDSAKNAGDENDEALVLRLLEISHVAKWMLADESARHCDGDKFLTLLDGALASKPHDEICMRQAPCEWSVAVAAGQVSGVVLSPITSTRMLVNATSYRNSLCSKVLQDACMQGQQAWWFASPVYGGGHATSAFGLTRTSEVADWTVASVLADQADKPLIERAAQSLAIHANSERRRAAIRQMSMQPRSVFVAARKSVSTLLQSCLSATADVTMGDTEESLTDSAIQQPSRYADITGKNWFECIEDPHVKLVFDTNAFLDGEFAGAPLSAIANWLCAHASQSQGRVLVHGAVINELAAKRKEPELYVRVAAASRLLERMQVDGIAAFPYMDDGTGEQHYADPCLLALCRETATLHPTMLITRDRDLRLRVRALAPAVRLLQDHEWRSLRKEPSVELASV